MKELILILLLVPTLASAQRFVESDTLWTDSALQSVAQSKATLCGIVKHVDTTANVATIRYFTREEEPHLYATMHVVASGDGKGLYKGKQLYFDQEQKVNRVQVYTLVHDERKGKIRNRLAAETFLYPDGKTREELNLSYEMVNGYERRNYVRKYYYPGGQLQYEETMDDKGKQEFVYYNEKGKVVKRPKQKIEPYLTMPAFPGGKEALFEFLSNTIKYPKVAQENSIQGRVIVQFYVAKDGSIEHVQVVRSGGDPSLDKEAVRVIKAMPRWQPGTQRGKPVRVQYALPVNFSLK